jgi:hypothetical protein
MEVPAGTSMSMPLIRALTVVRVMGVNAEMLKN